jgi:hypothetical protein
MLLLLPPFVEYMCGKKVITSSRRTFKQSLNFQVKDAESLYPVMLTLFMMLILRLIYMHGLVSESRQHTHFYTYFRISSARSTRILTPCSVRCSAILALCLLIQPIRAMPLGNCRPKQFSSR